MDNTEYAVEDKKKIRREILAKRDLLDQEAQKRGAILITERILGHQWYYNADIVFGFVSYGSELETCYILEDALKKGKQLYLPKVLGEEMEFFRISDLGQLRPGYKGILEPPTENLFDESNDYLEAHKAVMLMPGVAFDPFRNRIGYGKGFYDRYLSRFSYFQTYSIAIGHKIQMIENIPANAHDIKPYQVICV